MTPKPCPHPEKRRYSSRMAAMDVIRAMYRVGRGNPDLGAYLCVCDAWHVGNSRRHLHQRIKQALIPGRGRNTIYRRRGRRARR